MTARNRTMNDCLSALTSTGSINRMMTLVTGLREFDGSSLFQDNGLIKMVVSLNNRLLYSELQVQVFQKSPFGDLLL